MSYKYNQSRAERSESTQYRKTGRSGSSNHTNSQFSGGASTKGGGGCTDLSNRSFKKHNSNAQGGQPTTRSSNVDSSNSSTARALQNGGHHQQPTNNAPMQNITQAIPKAPPSNVSPASSESKAPKTSAKDPGDPSKSFRLQFGSISPGVMNGMQVPARTSSMPPNLHEHKQAQASLRTAPVMPIPSVPKQQQIPKKDAGILDHPNAGEAQPISKSQVSVAPSQKPTVHPIPSMPMQLPLHQPRVPVQLGGSNPQIQSRPISGPMPMPMSLPPPMFVPHPMQSQGMMHQNFPPQMGNMGMKPGPQFLQQPAQSKLEPDDWEDAAEISSPHLGTSENQIQDNDGSSTEKYSRDFLKFSEQCSGRPEGFEITSDIADTLVSSVNFSRDSYPSPGRNIDRPGAGSRAKFQGAVMSGQGDMRADGNNYAGNNIGGFRAGQGGNNYGVLRNPRAQPPVQYAGGIFGGPMQNFGPQGRNNSDSDRWQRATGFQRGLMPSPTPMAVMHKTEKKYYIGKVAYQEQAKQRQFKGILKKLTPHNFEKLFEQVKQVNIDNVITLSGVVSQIFDKALMEPTLCEMYANFCFVLAAELPDLSVDNEKITFKRLLLNKCQEEFERGEREEEEANKAEKEGEVKQTVEERDEKRRRKLGNIRLIGELYKKRLLVERVMHACINKFLGQYQNPDEENIEALCKLMSTIGETIDHPKAKELMDTYFEIMSQLSNNMKLSSRVRFVLKDAIDLRKNKWQQRRKVGGPKKIEEVHRDVDQERQAQSTTEPSSLSSSQQPNPDLRSQLPEAATEEAKSTTNLASETVDNQQL